MKVLDLFSGIGGFSLGLERAGFETVAFCEFDKKAQAVIRKNWAGIKIYDDVRTLTKEQMATDGIIRPDIICGGFPCQDISLAGKGAGLAGERSGLWFEFHRLISEIRPKYAIIENVSALRSRGLDEVLRSLAEIGYDAEWHCIPASAVGAPHRRDRVWIIAYPCIQNWPDHKAITQCSNANSIGSHREEINIKRSFESRNKQISEFGSMGEILAYSNDSRSGTQRHSVDGNGSKIEQGRQEQSFFGISGCGEDVTDPVREGLEGQRTLASRIAEELENPRYSCGWTVEPNVGRVANGVPGRVDRLKQLGNAVVPQIPELIGRAILNFELSKQ